MQHLIIHNTTIASKKCIGLNALTINYDISERLQCDNPMESGYLPINVPGLIGVQASTAGARAIFNFIIK